MIVLCRKEHPRMTDDRRSVRAQSPTCRLLALPAEIRTAIWELVLVQPLRDGDEAGEEEEKRRRRSKREEEEEEQKTQTCERERFCANVLRTCKQIHREGTPILYGSNTFAAHTSLLAALPAFLLRVRPRAVALPPVTSARMGALVRRFHVPVRLDTDPRFTRAQCTAAFAGADRLDLEVFQASYGTCDFGVLALFEGVRDVGAASVRGSVGDGRYADWLARVMMTAAEDEVPAFSEEYIGGDRAWDAWTNGNR